MTTVNVTNFKKDIIAMFEQTIKHNQPVNVVTKDGNAVVISEDDYNGLIATLEIYATPGLTEAILAGKNTPLSECTPATKVEW
jgi:PHD/YefM family antitoxin component YafN of YafNO toxin-antitoxin module